MSVSVCSDRLVADLALFLNGVLAALSALSAGIALLFLPCSSHRMPLNLHVQVRLVGDLESAASVKARHRPPLQPVEHFLAFNRRQ